jgi:uncharacterized damage-inducible protein DinB
VGLSPGGPPHPGASPDSIARLPRRFTYNAWANAEALRSLVGAGAVPPRAAEVMAHIVGAEWLWLRRLGYASPDVPVWPAWPLGEYASQLRALSAAWTAFLDSVTPESLHRVATYTNSKGERWSSTVEDVLLHVLLHSAYHRGQVATLLGRAGETAAYTDYIEFVRRGYAERGGPA